MIVECPLSSILSLDRVRLCQSDTQNCGIHHGHRRYLKTEINGRVDGDQYCASKADQRVDSVSATCKKPANHLLRAPDHCTPPADCSRQAEAGCEFKIVAVGFVHDERKELSRIHRISILEST